RRGWQVAVIINGSLDPLPPRHPTPAPRTIVPDVRELDRDTADAQVRDVGLVPAHIPSNVDANSRVSHQPPAAGPERRRGQRGHPPTPSRLATLISSGPGVRGTTS